MLKQELFNTIFVYQGLKGNRAFADLRYGRKDSISPNTLIFPATKG